MSTDYISKVGEKQFSDVQKGRKSEESKIEVQYSWLRDRLTILHSSKCTYKKCVMELNRAVDASRTKSKVVNSLRCYQVLYSRKLSREKNSREFQGFVAIRESFLCEIWGRIIFGSTSEQSGKVFSAKILFRESFLPRKFLAMRYSTDIAWQLIKSHDNYY